MSILLRMRIHLSKSESESFFKRKREVIVQVSVVLGKEISWVGEWFVLFLLIRVGEFPLCYQGGRLWRGEVGCGQHWKEVFRETTPGPCRRGGAEPLWDPPHDPPSSSSWWAGGEVSWRGWEKGSFWSPPWASCLFLLLPAPLPFLSHSGSPDPHPSSGLSGFAGQTAQGSGCGRSGAPQPALPPRRGWIGRITPIPQPLSSASGHREGIHFMIADVSPICQPLSSGSTDTAGIRPASADWPLSAPHCPPSHTKLEDSGALPRQGRGGKERGGEGRGGEGRVSLLQSAAGTLLHPHLHLHPAGCSPSRAAWMQTLQC